MTKRLAYLYLRVSTSQQLGGVSIDAQRQRCVDYCAANGLEVGDVFTDAGLSGKKMTNRPALQNAIKAACMMKGCLISYSLSRVARSTVDALAIAERLQKAGASLISLTENLDSGSPMGGFFFTLLAALAQMERDITSERTKMALRHLRSEGHRVSRHPPYGFDLSGCVSVQNPKTGKTQLKGGILTPNASEQATIEEMRRMRADGFTFSTISKILTEKGVLTKQRKTWVPSTVQRIIERKDAV